MAMAIAAIAVTVVFVKASVFTAKPLFVCVTVSLLGCVWWLTSKGSFLSGNVTEDLWWGRWRMRHQVYRNKSCI